MGRSSVLHGVAINKIMLTFVKKIISRYNPLENPAVPITSPECFSLSACRRALGIPITYRTLMGIPAVRKCVLMVSGHTAKLPLHILRTAGDGSEKIDRLHAAHKLLNRSPSCLYTPFVFRRQLTAYAMVMGNGMAFIVRNDEGTPTELLLLDPESSWIEMHGNEPVYKTTIRGKTFQFAAEDVFHIKDLGDGLFGDGLVSVAKDALGLSVSMLRHSCAYFRNGANGGKDIILGPQYKDREKREEFIEEYRKNNAGGDNAYKDKAWPTGTEIEKHSDNPDESQLNNSFENDIIRVANCFGIPVGKVGGKCITSYASLIAENQNYLDDCLDNWLSLWEGEIRDKLFTEKEKEMDARSVEFDRSELLRMSPDIESKMRLDKLNNGGINFPEYRHLEKLPPEKDENEEWRHPSNIVIEGDEPEPIPPVETEIKPDEKPVIDRSHTLTEQIVRRLIKRVAKSVTEDHKTDVSIHRTIFMENLAVWENAENWIDTILRNWQSEIDNCLPEQRQYIFNRELDLEDLWKS